MENKLDKIVREISNNIALLNYTHKVEKILFDNITEKDIFYYMMFLYEYDYVKDYIFFGKNIAKQNIFDKLYISENGKKCINYWDYILTDDICNLYKNTDILTTKNDSRKGKIVFLNKPDFLKKKSIINDKDDLKGVYGEQEVYNELNSFFKNNYNANLYGNYDVKLHKDEYAYQSDFIIVCDYAIFILEVKNWYGEIEIDEYGNCKSNGEFRDNPIAQNNRHVDDLRSFLISFLDIDIPIFPITIFTKKAHVTKIHKKYEGNVVNFDDINRFLSEKIETLHNGKKFDAKIISSLINFVSTGKYLYEESYNYGLINEIINFKNYEELNKKSHSTIITSESKYLKKYVEKINIGICFNNDPVYKGFSISGSINANQQCKLKYSRIVAVVYNFLIRNSNINCQLDLPQIFNIIDKYDVEIDIREKYPEIYKLMITILLLIKNNHCNIIDDTNIQVEFKYTKDNDIVELAIKCLNKYLEKFSLLSIGKKIQISYVLSDALTVGDDNYCDIKISNERVKTTNRLWCEDNVKYNVNDSNSYILVDILSEISQFNSFKEGQLKALIDVINSTDNKMVIMPTGSGKSLIYYMAALLQPKVSIIISPTNILIDNQIDNLIKVHNINSVCRLDFETNILDYHLLYTTPYTLQNDTVIRNLIEANMINCIYGFVLDEVHCLSFKSHSFNPEYFTLSKKLNQFFNKAVFLGFTATSEYDVTKDLMSQLTILEKNIISPIKIRTDRIKYYIMKFTNEDSMTIEFLRIYNSISAGKTLIFVKDNCTANYLFKVSKGNNILLYTEDDDSSLTLFLDDNSGFDFLICPIEFGIGLDFGNIKSIIHYGIPYSKMDYIQQIGRAGRNDEYSNSYVLYLDPMNFDRFLFDRNINYTDFYNILNKKDKNDYIITYKNIFNKFLNINKIHDEFVFLFNKIIDSYNKGFTTCLAPIDTNVTSLFILLSLGLIDYWGIQENKIAICIEKNINLSTIKNEFRKYLKNLGDNKLNIIITSSNSMLELSLLFFETFVNNYLNVKRNQVLELMTMLNEYSNQYNISSDLNKEMEKYFSLPFEHLLDIEDIVNSTKLQDINDLIVKKDKIILNAINYVEQLNNNSAKNNYLKLIKDIISKGLADNYQNKLIQIVNALNEEDIYFMFSSFDLILKEYINEEYYDDYINTTLIVLSDNVNSNIIMEIANQYIEHNKNSSNNYIILSIIFDKYFKKGGNLNG